MTNQQRSCNEDIMNRRRQRQETHLFPLHSLSASPGDALIRTKGIFMNPCLRLAVTLGRLIIAALPIVSIVLATAGGADAATPTAKIITPEWPIWAEVSKPLQEQPSTG